MGKDKYVPFHRERQEPIDKYSRKEVDEKLKQLKEVIDKRIIEAMKEINEQRDKQLKKIIVDAKERLEAIENNLANCYKQEKVDTFFKVLDQRTNNVENDLSTYKKNYHNLEDLVLKYLVNTGKGKLVGESFIPKKKWFKKKLKRG